jgi:hypothetical protein
MTPTIGRIVIYCMDRLNPPGEIQYPAIIFAVRNSEYVDLNVFTDEGVQVKHDVRFSATLTSNTWRWPEIKK